jgi:hypothetical protein
LSIALENYNLCSNAVLMKPPPGYSSQADFLITARKYAFATITLFLLVSMKGYTGAAGALQKDPINEANLTKVCQSQGGRFLPYALQGKEPRRIRGSETLSLCRAYKWKTCCGKEQTDAGKSHVSSRLCTFWSSMQARPIWDSKGKCGTGIGSSFKTFDMPEMHLLAGHSQIAARSYTSITPLRPKKKWPSIGALAALSRVH